MVLDEEGQKTILRITVVAKDPDELACMCIRERVATAKRKGFQAGYGLVRIATSESEFIDEWADKLAYGVAQTPSGDFSVHYLQPQPENDFQRNQLNLEIKKRLQGSKAFCTPGEIIAMEEEVVTP